MFELRPALNAREQGRSEKSVAMAFQPNRDPGDVPVDNPAVSRIYGSDVSAQISPSFALLMLQGWATWPLGVRCNPPETGCS